MSRQESSYQQDVIVDGLGDADDAALHVLLLALLLDGVRGSVPSVSSHCRAHTAGDAWCTPPLKHLDSSSW